MGFGDYQIFLVISNVLKHLVSLKSLFFGIGNVLEMLIFLSILRTSSACRNFIIG